MTKKLKKHAKLVNRLSTKVKEYDDKDDKMKYSIESCYSPRQRLELR